MDDARYVNLKGQGPTPPNTYKLVMREEPFHGVRAIRLVPVGDGKMFGRDGLLAHSYMLGPNGQSNGCVSFSDYPDFLELFLPNRIAGFPRTCKWASLAALIRLGAEPCRRHILRTFACG
jgi:hypothetical protein